MATRRKTADAQTTMVQDAWTNPFTGMGYTGKDKSASNVFLTRAPLGRRGAAASGTRIRLGWSALLAAAQGAAGLHRGLWTKRRNRGQHGPAGTPETRFADRG